MEVDSLLAMDNGHILGHHTVQRMLEYINHTSHLLMEAITHCEERFGTDAVLYDSKSQF